MGVTTDIGERIELLPMDPHFHDISIALYRQERDAGIELTVHTYSQKEGAQDRIAFVAQAMTVLGGMELVGDSGARVRFPCGTAHHLASKRVFLEACKLPTGSELAPRPLSIRDKKADANMIATNLGNGSYEMSSDGEGDKVAKRKSAVTAGLAKLAQLELDEGGQDRVEFPCGQSHDALVGLLLVRAPNVRVILREQEMAASRGQLAAPSAQQ